MRASIIAGIFVWAAAALALPNGGGGGGHPPAPICGGTYPSEECCATDVGGILGLDCTPPKKAPRSAKDFVAICAREGQQARCCEIPILGQAVLCEPPIA